MRRRTRPTKRDTPRRDAPADSETVIDYLALADVLLRKEPALAVATRSSVNRYAARELAHAPQTS